MIMPLTEREIAKLIDHTLLKPDATQDEIGKLCAEALQHQFASVCVNPWNVAQSAELLRGSTVKVCTVVGFPLGATLPEVKVFEAQKSIERGAQEIDMVINIGALKSRREHLARRPAEPRRVALPGDDHQHRVREPHARRPARCHA